MKAPGNSVVPAAYACGITAHGVAHVGNLRTIFAAYWQSKTAGLKLVVNHTDVSPKVDSGCPASYRTQLVRTVVTNFEESCKLLGLEVIFAPVSAHMDSVIQVIRLLEQRGLVRQHQDGLYFQDGEPGFVLWMNLSGHPHAYGTIGPRGLFGAPGWNLECAALIWHFTIRQGFNFRRHFGGHELKFPHHHSEARILRALQIEIPQWSYIGPVRCGGEKMSKSLGNVVYLPELVGRPCPYGRRFARFCFFCSPPQRAISLGPGDLASYRALYLRLLQHGLPLSDAQPYPFEQLHHVLRTHQADDPRLASTLRHFDIVPSFHQATMDAAAELRRQWNDLRKISEFEAADKLRKLAQDNGVLFLENRLKLQRIDRLTAWCRCIRTHGVDAGGLIASDE